MQFDDIIKKVSIEFIETFNDRDFDKLSLFLVKNFFVESDNIQKVFSETSENSITGLENVIDYWKKLVAANPSFRFDTKIIHISNEGKNILYSGFLTNGKPYHAKFTINEYAKFECLIIEYPESI